MILHETIVHGRCPLNDQWDYYDVDIETDEFIDVHKLEEILNDVRGLREVQEDIARRIAGMLRSKGFQTCHVTVTGRHSQNMQTTVTLTTEDLMKSLLLVIVLSLGSVANAGDWKGNEQVLVDHPTIQSMYRTHCKHRERNGLKPQQLNGRLCRAAQEWSAYMAKHHYFEHSHFNVAENIAMGANTASGAMSMWIGSRGHNANLLGGAEQVGFGVAESGDGTRYWTSCHGSGF